MFFYWKILIQKLEDILCLKRIDDFLCQYYGASDYDSDYVVNINIIIL